MKKRVWPTIIAIVVIALVGTIAVSVIYYRFTSANRDPTMTGCVILRRDSIVFIYVDSDTMWDGVWTIDSNNVTFISHDDSITTVNDLYPGMMVQVLCYDEVIDAIFRHHCTMLHTSKLGESIILIFMMMESKYLMVYSDLFLIWVSA